MPRLSSIFLLNCFVDGRMAKPTFVYTRYNRGNIPVLPQKGITVVSYVPTLEYNTSTAAHIYPNNTSLGTAI